MKRQLLIVAGLLLMSLTAYAMNVSGKFTSDTAVSISNGNFLLDQVYGSLKFENQVSERLYGMAEIDVRYYNQVMGSEASNRLLIDSDLMSMDNVISPVEIGLHQAYFTYNDFLLKNMDLSVGKQRIQWGTADKLNPTDLLNPNEFIDPFEFGAKRPSWALNFKYYLPFNDSFVQLVYEPVSAVARFNPLMISEMAGKVKDTVKASLSTGVTSFQDLSGAGNDMTVIAPAPCYSNLTAGLKFGMSIKSADFSVSVLRRVNDIMMPVDIVNDVTMEYTITGQTNVTLNNFHSTWNYHKETVIGADFSADLGFMVLRGEASLTFPDVAVQTLSKSTVTVITPGATNVVSDIQWQTVLSNEAYVKYTIGGEKDFGAGWTINLQFNHGFYQEAGAANLQDYLALAFYKHFLDDKLEVGTMDLVNVVSMKKAFEASSFSDYIKNNYGLFGSFYVKYMPEPSVSLEVGVRLLDGTDSSSFGIYKDMDHLYGKFEYSF